MSNLSELIPAGGGQNNTDFVADGAIASGKPVILNSAGTVTQVGQSAASSIGVGTPVVFNASNSNDHCITFDSTSNKIVVGYRTSSTGYGIVGTVSATSISYGSATALPSNANMREASMAYDSTNNKVVMSYRSNDDDYGYAAVGTITGTAIAWGTPVAFASAKSEYTNCVYDSSNSKIVIAFNDGANSQYGTAIVGTVSGASISFGSEAVFNSGESSKISMAYDSSNNKVVISCRDETSSVVGSAVVGTVSSTSISFGTKATFNSGGTSMIGSSFDTTANKVVFSYQDGTNSDYGTSIVGTVSGTSISFGTAAVFNTDSVSDTSCSYDTGADRTVISYMNGSPDLGKAIAAAVSGTNLSFNTAVTFNSAATTFVDSVYDSSAGKVITVYKDTTGRSVVLSASATNLTATNLLGIASAVILNTATGTINTWGSRNEVQTSLTIGSDYYVQSDGTITTASASPAQLIGEAITATQINIKDYTG